MHTTRPPIRALRSILAQLGHEAGSRNAIEIGTAAGSITVHVDTRRPSATEIGLDLIADDSPRPPDLAQRIERIADRFGATERRAGRNYVSLTVRPERAPLALLELLGTVGVLERVPR